MKLSNTSQFLFVSGLALATACSSDEITCGEGTEKDGNECVASAPDDDVPDGMGGGAPDVVEPDQIEGVASSRQEDAKTVRDEFEGALAAGAASDTSALVVWSPSSVGGVEYNVYVSTDEDSFSFGTPQHEAPEGSSSFLVTGAEAGQELFIVVRAVIDGVELVGDDKVVSVQLEVDTEAPSFVGIKDVETLDNASVRVTWDAATDDVSPGEALTYFVYGGETTDSIDTVEPIAVSLAGATSVEIKMPEPDKESAFMVLVRDAAGNFDDNAVPLFGTSGPDSVSPVFSGCETAIARNATAIQATWIPATDDIATEDEIIYELFASTEPNGHNFAMPTDTTVGGSSGIVSGLDPDVEYYVICRAKDSSGNTEENTRLQSARTKDDDQPPVFAGITQVENIGAESLDLVWNAATDNQTAAENIVYRLYLSDTADGHDFEEAPYLESAPGAVSIAVQDLTSRTEYFLIVVAVDEAGNQSEPSSASPVTTLVSLLKDVELPIFTNKCATAGCHSGDTPISGLNLAPGFSFTNLVDVLPTTTGGTDSGLDRVEPFDPAASHLVQRIESADPVFGMPQGSDILSTAEIATIRQWITEGALNN